MRHLVCAGEITRTEGLEICDAMLTMLERDGE